MLVTSVFRRESPDTPISEALWLMMSGRAVSLLIMTLISLRHWNCGAKKTKQADPALKAASEPLTGGPAPFIELGQIRVDESKESKDTLQSSLGVQNHTGDAKLSEIPIGSPQELIAEADAIPVEPEVLKNLVTVSPSKTAPAMLLRAKAWTKIKSYLEFNRAASRLREWRGAHCLAALSRLRLRHAFVPIIVPIFKGIGYVFYTILMGRGDVSLYSAVAGSYNLIPVVYGLTFRKEKRSWNKMVGIVFSTLAVLSVGLSEAFTGKDDPDGSSAEGAGDIVVNLLLVLCTLFFWGVGDTITSYWGKKVPMRATLFLGMVGNLFAVTVSALVMRIEIGAMFASPYNSASAPVSLNALLGNPSNVSLSVWQGTSPAHVAVGLEAGNNASVPFFSSELQADSNCTNGVVFDAGLHGMHSLCLDGATTMMLVPTQPYSFLKLTVWHFLLFAVNFGPVVGWYVTGCTLRSQWLFIDTLISQVGRHNFRQTCRT